MNNVKLKIIGVEKVIDDTKGNDVLNLIFTVIAKNKEIEYDGSIARLIRYESHLSDGKTRMFVGIEVPNINSIPKGMVAWEISDSNWEVYKEDNGITLISNRNIAWRWIGHSLIGGWERYIGDFNTIDITDGETKENDYCITANAYYDFTRPMEGGDKVEIVEYDCSWTKQYDKFSEWIINYIGQDIAREIEHIGSTAIPNMPAKPSIDVLIEVPSVEEGRKRIIPLLNDKTWEYWWMNGDILFYKRNGFMGKRTHYVHIAPKNDSLWERVAFRDYLKNNKEYAKEYAKLKKKLSISSGGEWMKYTNDKSNFVREVTERALSIV